MSIFSSLRSIALAAAMILPAAAFAQTPEAIELVTGPLQTVAGTPIKGSTTDEAIRPQVKVTSGGVGVSGVNVVVALDGGSFASGTTTVTTDSTGIATFDDLIINQAQGGYRLNFSVSGSPSVTVQSAEFPVVFAPAQTITMSVEPQNTQWDLPVAGSPTVLVQDAFGNPVGGVNVLASLSSGSFTAGSTRTVQTDTQGLASFTNLVPVNTGDGYTITFDPDATGVANVVSAAFNVTKKVLTIGGTLSASDKVYDGNASATVNTSSLTLSGLRSGDVVSLSNVQAAFAQATVGTGLVVSITSADLTGAGAGNYELSLAGAPTANANITAKTLTLKGSFIAENKIYDDTTDAEFRSNNLELDGVVNGDAVFLTNTKIVFVQATVGTGIRVNVASSSLTGAKAANYTLSLTNAPFSSANITQKPLLITGTFMAKDKVYDKKQDAEIDENNLGLDGVITADVGQVTLVPVPYFVNFNVGTWEVKLNTFATALTGAKATNYRIDYTGAPTTTATITQKLLKLGGSFDAASKQYDGTTSATITSNFLTLLGIVNGDTVTLDKPLTQAEFVQSSIGSDIEVQIVSVVIGGGSAGNYSVDYEDSPTTTADITVKTLTIGGSFGVLDKVYDGTTAATILPDNLSLVGVVSIGGVPDDVSLNAVANFASVNVGTNISVGLLESTITGTSAVNYVLSYAGAPTTTADITQAPLTIDVGPASRTADPGLPNPPPSFSITGLVTGDTDVEITGTPVVYTSVNESTTTVGVYPDDLGLETNGSKVGNYDISMNKGTLTITAAAPAALTVVADPIATTAGQTIQGLNVVSFAPEAPTVLLQDTYGNDVAGQNVTVSLGQFPDGPSSVPIIGGTQVATDSDGQAVYSNLSIQKSGDGYYFNYVLDSDASIQVVSKQFSIIAAAADAAEIIQEPTNADAGKIIQPSPVVLLTDQFGNPTEGPYKVTASLTDGTPLGGTLEQETPQGTGLATFDDLFVEKAGTYTMTFTPNATGVSPVISDPFVISPDKASASIAMEQQPSQTVAGVAISPAPSVRVADRYDNPISGYAITPALSKNSFASGAAPVTTGANGVAAFSALKINKADTGYTIAFSFQESVPSVSGQVTSASFAVIHAALNKFQFAPVTSLQTAGQAFGLTITALDEFDNTVTSFGGTVGLTLNQNAFASGGGTTPSFTAGVLANHNVTINKAATGYTITATQTGGAASGSSSEFAVQAAAAAKLGLVGPATVVAGVPSGNFTLTVYDVYDNVAKLSAVSTFGLQTDVSPGTATFSPAAPLSMAAGTSSKTFTYANTTVGSTAGTAVHQLTADFATGDSGLAGQSAQANINVTAAPAAKLVMVTQPSATAKAGAVFAQQPAVRVTDQFGNAVAGAGVPVTASIATGGLALIGATAVATDSSGIATYADLGIGGLLGVRTLQFSATGLTSVVSTTVDVNTVGDPSSLVVTTQPRQMTAGGALSPVPAVTLSDAYGNPIAGQTVDVSLLPSTYSFAAGSTTQLVTDASGVAAFGNLKIEVTYATYQLKFVSGSLEVVSNQFAVRPAAPQTVAIDQQPQDGAAGNALSPVPSVVVKDAFGNGVPGVNVDATLNGGSFASGVTVQSTGLDGKASYYGLVITEAKEDYTITFKARTAPRPEVTSATFEITANFAEAAATVTQQPQTTSAGKILVGPPTVVVADPYGNPVANNDLVVSLIGGTFNAGTTTLTTDAAGQAVFDDLVVNTAGTYSLRFVGQGPFTGNVPSAEFAVVAAEATQVVLVAQPVGGRAGELLATQPRLEVWDQFGNVVVADNTTQISATIASGTGGVLGGTTNVSVNQGVATYTDLTFGGLVSESYVLQFASSPTIGAPVLSDTFQVTAGVPSLLEVVNQPILSTAGEPLVGLSGQPVQVLVTDGFGNPSPGVLVSPTPVGFTFAAGGAPVQSSLDGVAEFSSMQINTAGTGYMIHFESNDVAPIVTDEFIIESAAPATAREVVAPSNTPLGSAINPAPQVELLDDFGNPVQGYNIEAQIPGGFVAGSVSVAQTGTDGRASFAQLIPGVIAASTKLTYIPDADGVPDLASSNFEVYALAAAASLDLQGSTADMFVGETRTLTAYLRDSEGQVVRGASSDVVFFLQPGSTGALDGLGNVSTVDGVASIEVMATSVGTVEIVAASGGLNSQPLSFQILDALPLQILNFELTEEPAPMMAAFSTDPTEVSSSSASPDKIARITLQATPGRSYVLEVAGDLSQTFVSSEEPVEVIQPVSVVEVAVPAEAKTFFFRFKEVEGRP